MEPSNVLCGQTAQNAADLHPMGEHGSGPVSRAHLLPRPSRADLRQVGYIKRKDAYETRPYELNRLALSDPGQGQGPMPAFLRVIRWWLRLRRDHRWLRLRRRLFVAVPLCRGGESTTRHKHKGEQYFLQNLHLVSPSILCNAVGKEGKCASVLYISNQSAKPCSMTPITAI